MFRNISFNNCGLEPVRVSIYVSVVKESKLAMALLHTLHYNWDNFDGEAAFRWGIPMGSHNSYVDNRIVNGRKSVMVWVRRMGGALVHLFST